MAEGLWSAAEPGRGVLTLRGAWTVHGLAPPPRLDPPFGTTLLRIDSDGLVLDTCGALVLLHAIQGWKKAGLAVDLQPLSEAHRQLLDLVAQRALQQPVRSHEGFGPLRDIGRAALTASAELQALLAFVGELALRGVPLLLRPWRIRWREVVAEIDAAGLRALGIIGLLSFLIGMVMAYQAGATLATYGANILIVNLVSIITLRELGPLLTAILVAGRTGSSYTAQLGTMRITEEVDALRALGLSPFDMLVLPKVIALLITLPLLALFADVMGLAGGGVVAALGYGVPWTEYVARIPQVVGLKTLMLGLVKAPVFAVVIALVGCMQGLRVAGSAAAVGRATTVSVVQSIFLVIVIDAGFSILYNLMHL
jgi:phospholipid/cholesterol/gamma-HCH transport system permease protein